MYVDFGGDSLYLAPFLSPSSAPSQNLFAPSPKINIAGDWRLTAEILFLFVDRPRGAHGSIRTENLGHNAD